MPNPDSRQPDPAVLERYSRSFTKEEINDLPLRRYRGPIHLLESDDIGASVIEVLALEPVLGFDTESKPCFSKNASNPPALLQLATADAVYLFRLNGGPLAEEIIHVLSDPDKVKAGVAVWDDIKGLQGLSDFEAAGFLDLGDLSRSLGLPTNGLRNLAANLLGFRISKNAQRSNWAKAELTEQQIHYAATDAWVSRELYLKIKAEGLI